MSNSHEALANLARALLVISGKVQAVGYRFWTLNQAHELGITGSVKNLSDGRVEAIIEGEKGELEKLIDRAKQGPTFASVSDIEVMWGDYTGDFQDFTIER